MRKFRKSSFFRIAIVLCGIMSGQWPVDASFHAQYIWQNFQQNTGGVAVKQITLTPLWTITANNVTNLVPAVPRSLTTGGSASATFSNMIAGAYRVELFAAPGQIIVTFTNVFGTNVSGLVNAADYISVPTNTSSGIDSAYSQVEADARFVFRAGDTMAGPLYASNFNGIIYVSTNDVNGLNNALARLLVATNKMYSGGGKIILQGGAHYTTYPCIYSNEFPAGIEIEGEVMPGTSVVYIGPSTNVAPFQFLGNTGNLGELLHVRIDKVQLSQVYDTTNAILYISSAGHVEIDGCSFAPWVIATNNDARGIAISEALLTTRYTNLVGIILSGCQGVGNTIRSSEFRWLQAGVYDDTDHVLIEDSYFSLCGGGPNQTTVGTGNVQTGWPADSVLRIGGGIVKSSTASIADTLYLKDHFTRCFAGIADFNPFSTSKNAAFCRFEDCTYLYIEGTGGIGVPFVFLNCSTVPETSINGSAFQQAGTNAVTTTDPDVKIIGTDTRLDGGVYDSLFFYSIKTNGVSVDGSGNTTVTKNLTVGATATVAGALVASSTSRHIGAATMASTLGVAGRSDFTNFVVLKTNLPSAIPSLTGGTVLFWPSNNGSLYIISANNAGTLTTNLIVAPH